VANEGSKEFMGARDLISNDMTSTNFDKPVSHQY
jgi:hypothetical protein